MPNSEFKIIPTPPISIKLESGQDGVFSFTVESLAVPDKVIEIMPRAWLLDQEGKGKEVDWLVAGPKPTLTMSGGETVVITITAKPKLTGPVGEHRIKLVIAETGRPNDVYAESAPVFCTVTALRSPDKPPPPRRWLIPVIAGGVLLLGGGALAWWLLKPPPPPVAALSAEPLSGPIPLTVSFQNKSTGTLTKIEWNFGDGSAVSSERNPSHTYDRPATYAVALTVEDKRGRSSTAQLVVKAESPAPPQAIAAGEPLAGRAPLTVKLQDRSTGNPSKVEWRFGDNTPISTERNPIHVYQAPGTYTIELTARDNYGGATTAQLTVRVDRPEGPVAVASATPLTGRVPLTVQFQNRSSGSPARVQWIFGDDTAPSAEANPRHTYQKPGSYTPSLTIWDRFGASGTTQLAVKVEAPPPPVAAATAVPLTGRIPLTVQFQNRSTGNPSSVTWSFGDGSAVSTASNPTHVYQKAGLYTVELTAKDIYGGSSTAQLTIKAEPPPPPVARFTPSVTAAKWPVEVVFTNSSQNITPDTQWLWTFGDGSISREQTPRHRYENPGDYKVHLKATNANGSGDADGSVRVLSRRGELATSGIGPFGGAWGNWAGAFQRCPGTMLAYGFEDKVEPSQGGGDDTALNGIKLWCVNLPDLQSNTYITSDYGGWGTWSERMDCKDARSYLVGARLRIEPSQGSGDDTGAVDVELSCSNGTILRNGGHDWGAWRDWSYCPANTAICGIRTRVEPSLGGGDDTALNDVQLQCCYVK